MNILYKINIIYKCNEAPLENILYWLGSEYFKKKKKEEEEEEEEEEENQNFFIVIFLNSYVLWGLKTWSFFDRRLH